MKLIFLILLALASCTNARDLLSEQDKPAYDGLLLRESALTEASAAADAAGDTARVAEIAVELRAIDEEIQEIERRAVRERFGPVWGFLATLPVVGPYMQIAGPFAASFILPVFSSRGRRRYLQAFRELAPWVSDANGERGVNLFGFVLEILKAFGLLHSTPASAKAANR